MAKKRKITGERDMFIEIWNEREHICENCNQELSYEPRVHYFSHIKSKGAHPSLRLEKSNIQLLCMDCHYAYDFQGKVAFENRKL